jgi:hypothetical protein
MNLFKIVLAALLISFSAITYSQAALLALIFGDKVASEKFNIGLEAGGSFTFITKMPYKKRSALSINFGISGNLQLSKQWYFSPTAYFSAGRVILLEDAPIYPNNVIKASYTSSDAKLSVNYVDLPLFFFYQIKETGFRLGIAPQFSFRTNANIDYEIDGSNHKIDIKHETIMMEFGLLFSTTYVMFSGRKGKGLHIGLRYFQGFTNSFKKTFVLAPGPRINSYIGVNLSFPFISDDLAEKHRKPKKSKKTKKKKKSKESKAKNRGFY